MNRRAFTVVELLVVVAIIALLVGILLPAVNSARNQSKVTFSQSNLRNLATAHASYGASWGDRHFTLINDNIATYGDYAAEAFATFSQKHANEHHPPIRLGWAHHPLQGWGNYAYALGGPFGIGNYDLPQPLVFSGPLKYGGAFRLHNVAQFNQYVSGRFYDPVFYAPKDDRVIDAVDQGFADPDEFSFNTAGTSEWGFVPVHSSYILSPAAMFHPDVFRHNDPSDSRANGAVQDVWSLPRAFRSPTMSQARYPHLKTHMLEHHWLQNQRAACNPGFEEGSYEGCEPYYFNHSWNSTPVTLFFDGSVRLSSVSEATRDDARMRGQSGTDLWGLWSRDTAFGTDGYLHEYGYDMAETSYHILTTDGIQGRDFTSAGGS